MTQVINSLASNSLASNSLASKSSVSRPVRLALAFAGLLLAARPAAAGEARPIPAPELEAPAGQDVVPETAILAGGCFWGVQGVFQHVKGVMSAVSGYAGGGKTTASYETVSSGTTNHAESVAVSFDPRQVSYGRILQIYFSVAHDPTELNRQGPDEGSQYRSAIFPLNGGQERIAKAYIGQLNKAHVFDAPVVTGIEPDRSSIRPRPTIKIS